MMQKLATATGVAYVVLGLSVAISPEWMISVVDWESRQGRVRSVLLPAAERRAV